MLGIIKKVTTEYIGDDLTPCPVWEYNNSSDDHFVIINSPNVKLQNKFIQPDPVDPACVNLNGKNFIEHWTLVIFDEDSSPDTRDKPLFATVAGEGKGKTRFLVETVKALHVNHNVFALPVTFNNKTPRLKSCFGKTGAFAYAYEVVWRMLSMVYRIDEGSSYWSLLGSAIATVLMRFDGEVSDKDNFAVSLIRGCIQFLMMQYLNSRPAMKDTKSMFVLLMDESMQIVDMMNQEDHHSYLRQALLDDWLFANNQNVHCNLVMSSLDISPLGKTSSRRAIVGIPLPTKLDPKSIMEDWILPLFPPVQSDKDRAILMKLVHLVADLPRAAECLVKAMKYVFQGKPITFDNWEDYKGLTTKLMSLLKTQYGTIDTPSSDVMKAVLWRQPLVWDKRVSSAVVDSFIVNAPSSFSSEEVKFVPEISALSLYRLKDIDHPIVRPLIKEAQAIIDKDPEIKNMRKQGDCMENLMNGIVSARLACSDSTFSIRNLLQYSPSDSTMETVFPTRLFNPKLDDALPIVGPLPKSHRPKRQPNLNHQYIEALCDMVDLQKAFRRDVCRISLHRSDHCNGMYFFSSGRFVVILDAKTRLLNTTMSDPKPLTKIKPDLRQANRVIDIIKPHCKLYLESKGRSIQDDRSVGAALARDDFVYVYVTNYPGNTYSARNGTVVVLNEVDTINFLMSFGKTLHDIEMINQTIFKQPSKKTTYDQ